MADFEDAAGQLQGETMTMIDDLHPTAEIPVGPEPVDRCKVDGCFNRVDVKLGPYGGLCVSHANEKKAERKAKDAAKKTKAEKPEKSTEPVDNVKDSAMRELLMDLVMLDDDELDLPAMRLDAARLLLGR